MTLAELAILSIPTLGILFKFSMLALGMHLMLRCMSNYQEVIIRPGKH